MQAGAEDASGGFLGLCFRARPGTAGPVAQWVTHPYLATPFIMKSVLAPSPEPAAPDETESPLRFVLVSFRDFERADDHPELEPYLLTGWIVRDVEPRLVEGEGPRLLVTLYRARAAAPLPESRAA